MLKFFQRDVSAVGSVFYRGTLPPRAEEYSFLESAGIAVAPAREVAGAHWSLKLSHPEWGEADLLAMRDMPAPPRAIVDLSLNMSAAEKAEAAAAGTGVSIKVAARKKNILKDRKGFLRYLRAVMSDDGVVAADHASRLFWPRAALDDELSHDADPDISALYCLHAVTGEEEEERCVWLHTHGLAELGAFDFDILNPSDDVVSGAGADAVRAIAYAVAEGAVEQNTRSFELAHPGGKVRLVPASEFDRAAPAAERALRMPNDGHVKDRAVVCDPAKGILGLGGGVRASRFLQGPVSEGSLVLFTEAATELMAQRARATIQVFRRMMAEFAEFDFPMIAKIGYETDRGGGQREHLWFEVHGVGNNGELDATLASSPFDIARMKQGDRGKHPLEKLTDWTIITPAGHINPRHLSAARVLREHKDEMRAAMKEGPA